MKRIAGRPSVLLATAGVLLAVVMAGCGGSGKGSQPTSGASPVVGGYGAPADSAASSSTTRASTPSTKSHPPTASAAAASSRAGGGAQGAERRVSGAFSWLRAAPAPKRWGSATIASGGATLFYPPNWKPIPGDRGTVTAALRDSKGLYRGYLNVTPRQGAEQPAGWAEFRTRRNTQDGDQGTRTIAAGENLRLTGARGSCVIDDYLSKVGSHPYREVACIFTGSRYTNVFVGATLVRDWPALGPAIERADSALIER
jgi:hypothetical protein